MEEQHTQEYLNLVDTAKAARPYLQRLVQLPLGLASETDVPANLRPFVVAWARDNRKVAVHFATSKSTKRTYVRVDPLEPK